jgi:pSer/pThr/pTyr-binding forkhead associated (FHA) protein
MIRLKLNIIIMSGVEDGSIHKYDSQRGDGKINGSIWTITIGRLDESDMRLVNDTYISRHHANIHWSDHKWWLEDCNSRNGTFIISQENFFQDKRVRGIVPLQSGQLFRLGRTWLRIQV